MLYYLTIQPSFVVQRVVLQLTTIIQVSQTITIKMKNTIIKLSEDEASSSKMEETIPGTFDFINGHGGFLNEDFRLFSTNNQSGELTYQRFLNGYPTFNKEGANQIQVTWGEKGVFDYRRSLLRTDVVLNSEDNKTLPKLESVRSSLANNSDINFEK